MYKIINKKKLLATMAVDVIGNIVFSPRLLFRKEEEIRTEAVRNILIIRSAYIGDVVMTVPILKPMRERFPHARISFLTSTAAKPILQNNPHLDEIVTYNPFWFYSAKKREYLEFIKGMRKRVFDLVIEARGDIRELLFLVAPLRTKYKVSYAVGGGRYLLTHVVPYQRLMHKVEYHLNIAKYLGCRIDGIEWGVYLTAEEKNKVKAIMRSYKIQQPFISAHPGSRLPLKMWPSERCAILYDKIIEKYGMPLVILSSPEEREMVDHIVRSMKHKPITLAGSLGLREMAGVLSESALFICNDSAPMHIAAAMKTPTVAIFGPSKSRETGPYGTNCRVVEKDFPCRFSCDENVCRHRVYHECMQAITPEDVYSAAADLIGRHKSAALDYSD